MGYDVNQITVQDAKLKDGFFIKCLDCTQDLFIAEEYFQKNNKDFKMELACPKCKSEMLVERSVEVLIKNECRKI